MTRARRGVWVVAILVLIVGALLFERLTSMTPHIRDQVASGRFVMRAGSIQFSQLTFAVPGAIVQLAGRYNLRSEAIDFAGHLLLEATLAQMTTGVRSATARLAQPLFRRPGGGSKLPIRISGTRSKPSFGLDIKRALLPG